MSKQQFKYGLVKSSEGTGQMNELAKHLFHPQKFYWTLRINSATFIIDCNIFIMNRTSDV